MKKKKQSFRLSIFGLALYVLIFTIISVLILYKGFDMVKSTQNEYKSSTNIDYSVYLKENDYFIEDHLGKDQKYIASIIDHIPITFTFDLKNEKMMSGAYDYQIIATLEVKEANKNKVLWQRDYVLSNLVTNSFKDSTNISFSAMTDIDYDYYNEIVKSFKKQYAVSIDANLVVKLKTGTNFQSGYVINKESSVSIPLSEQTIEISLSRSNTDVNVDTYTYVDKPVLHYTLIAFGLLFLMIYGVMAYDVIVKIIVKISSQNKYKLKLKKIFSNYDQIIVNSEVDIDFGNVNIVDVTSFEELIDAQAEIHKPIIYKGYDEEEDRYSVFAILDDAVSYRFILTEHEIKYQDKGSKK